MPKDIMISFVTDVFAMTAEQARQFEKDWQLVTMIDASALGREIWHPDKGQEQHHQNQQRQHGNWSGRK